MCGRRVGRGITRDGTEGCAVAIANYEDFATGQEYRRVPAGRLGDGVAAATRLFRHVSFVSGFGSSCSHALLPKRPS